MADLTNPSHYKNHPGGIECIEFTRHMSFRQGGAFKYVFRAGKKDDELLDYKKAMWYTSSLINKADHIDVSSGFRIATREVAVDHITAIRKDISTRRRVILELIYLQLYDMAHDMLTALVESLSSKKSVGGK